MATIGAANDPLSFVLTVPDEDTPAVPFSGLFTPMANSILAALVRLKKQLQSMQTFPTKVTAVSGWEILAQNVRVYGENVSLYNIQLKKTGSALSVPNDGNMGNVIVAQLSAGFEPENEVPLSAGDTGRLLAGYITPDGAVKLSAMSNGYDVNVGDIITMIGMGILNNPVRSSI